MADRKLNSVEADSVHGVCTTPAASSHGGRKKIRCRACKILLQEPGVCDACVASAVGIVELGLWGRQGGLQFWEWRASWKPAVLEAERRGLVPAGTVPLSPEVKRGGPGQKPHSWYLKSARRPGTVEQSLVPAVVEAEKLGVVSTSIDSKEQKPALTRLRLRANPKRLSGPALADALEEAIARAGLGG